MTERGSTWDREDLGGGQFQHTQSLRPVNYLNGGGFQPIVNDFVDSGVPARPHSVNAAPLRAQVGDGGDRRLYPDPTDLDVYMDIGRPYIVATMNPHAFGGLTRSNNRIAGSSPLADLTVDHGGDFSKLGIELKAGWKNNPPDQFAFPVTLSGLVWSNGVLLQNGAPVMRLIDPVMYDLDNPASIVPITWSFANISGQNYLIFDTPDPGDMDRPFIDPTLTLQPDATAGIDTSITQRSANSTNGTGTFMGVGEATFAAAGPDRGLIKFDLSSIPASATITSAIMSLWLDQSATLHSDNARTMRAFRVLRAWVESQATWNVWSTGNSWGTAGASNTTTDREATDIGSCAFILSEAAGTKKDFMLSNSAVQQWVSGAFTNNGVVLINDTENEDFFYLRSSDSTTSAQRPQFVVIYTAPSGRGLFTIPFGSTFQGAFGA